MCFTGVFCLLNISALNIHSRTALIVYKPSIKISFLIMQSFRFLL